MRDWKNSPKGLPGRLARRIFVSVCALCLTLGMADVGGLTARAENYTYTVRFFAGQQGTLHAVASSRGEDPDGKGEVLVFSGLSYGDRVTFNQNMVTLRDGSKYYVKGIRESGKDNNTISLNSFVVTGDQDYVVAYGILGSAVAYTVNYVDAAGNPLAPSETYYGNVGDKAVIAYLYIDGYQPQAYNIGMTLKENAAENVINFVYTRVPVPTAPVLPGQPGGAQPGTVGQPGGQGGTQPGQGGAQPGGQPGGVVNQGGTNFDGLEGAGGEGQEGQPGAGGAEGQPGAGGAEGQPGGAGGQENPGGADVDDGGTPAGPDEYLDIDDQDVPQAGGIGPGQIDAPVQVGRDAVKISFAASIVVAAVSIASIVIGLFLILKSRKRKRNEQ